MIGPTTCDKCGSHKNADYTCPVCDRKVPAALADSIYWKFARDRDSERAAKFGRKAALEIVEKHWPILRDALDKLFATKKDI